MNDIIRAKIIEDFPNYSVLDSGEIFSIKRKITLKGGLLKVGNGYRCVSLVNGSIQKTKTIHRLVAKAFVPNPENKPEVNHIDGNTRNNHFTNLEWTTRSENQQHAYNTGLQKPQFGKDNAMFGKFGKLHQNSKTVFQYGLKGNFIKKWDSLMDINRELGFGIGHISQCCNKQRNFSNGFIWTYKEGDIIPFDLNCIVCGKEIIYNPKSRNQKYCSTRCSNKFHYEHRYTLVEKFIRNCKICGTEFKARNSLQSYCSTQCRDKWNRGRRIIREEELKSQRQNIIKTCELCKNEFTAVRISVRFCSDTCQGKAGRERRDPKQEKVNKNCEFCNNEFMPGISSQKYCNQYCSNQASYKRRGLPYKSQSRE